MRLQARYQTLQNAVDSAYEDQIRGVISEDLFMRKRRLWESEMADVQNQLNGLKSATHSYQDEALKLLELAQVAYTQYLAAPMTKKADILRCTVSNFSFDGVSATPTHRKPFDILAEGSSLQDWQPLGESNPCLMAENHPS